MTRRLQPGTRAVLTRRLQQLLIALYAAAMLAAAAMVIGPATNDAAIASDPGRGLATVTGTGLRTYVEFQGEDGRVHAPRTGLLYPSGLAEGQHVWVTYAKSNPDLVKVEGRAWTLALRPAISVALLASVLFAAAWFALKRQARHSGAPKARHN